MCSRSTRKTSSSRSSASSKRAKAKAEMELKQAQLEALHLKERIAEQSAQASLEARLCQEKAAFEVYKSEREAQKKIELAMQKCEILGEIEERGSQGSLRSTRSAKPRESLKSCMPVANVEKLSNVEYGTKEPN